MATVSTAIELTESYESIMYEIETYAGIGVAAAENLRGAMETSVAVSGIEAAAASYLQISRTVSSATGYIEKNTTAQEKFNESVEKGKNKAGGLSSAIQKAKKVLEGVSGVMKLSDQLTETTSRLGMMNDGMQTTRELQNMVYLSAERTRSGYEETAAAVSQMGLAAGNAFGSSAEIIGFTEQVSKQLQLAGVEASEMDSVMDKVVNTMSGGTLEGKTYTDILQQAPGFIQTIADYMGKPREELDELAASGGISAETIKSAMFAAADEANAKFESMPMTFSQIGTSVKNGAVMAVQPALEKINEIMNSGSFQTLAGNMMGALAAVASIAAGIFGVLAGAAGIISDNWSWLAPIIYGVAAAFAVYFVWQKAVNTVTKVSEGIHSAIGKAQELHALATGALTTATGADAAAQTGLNAAMAACPIVWIIILIIALVALFYAAIGAVNKFAGTSLSATGIICGGIMMAAAYIGNMFVTLINFVIDIFVVFWNFIAAFVNFFGNVFRDPIGSIARLFFDLVDTALGLLESLASAVDTMFGSDLAGSVRGWRDSLSGWAGDTFGEGEKIIEEIDGEQWHLGRFEYGEAWDAGYDFGEGIEDSIESFDPGSYLEGSVLGTDEFPGLPGYEGADEFPDLPGYEGETGDLDSNVGNIAENTGAMKDSMDMTEEDMQYMRDLAEQEVVNRFPTAEIIIEQTNHNTIKGKFDLDGIISGLTDAANEAVNTMAEGVHT